MQECLVALGSNLPNTSLTSLEILRKSLELLHCESVKLIGASRIYRTPAFPEGAGPDFLNAVASLKTDLTPEALLEHLHKVETMLGRTRKNRWEARICDLDLLAYGDAILPDRATYQKWVALPAEHQQQIAPEHLILPHPRLAERGFVLRPMADVAPDWVHPVTGKTVLEMLDALPSQALAGITPI